MIKVKVLISFNDKHTGKKYKKGDVLDVTPSRFNEILKKGRFVEAVEETPSKDATKK